MKIRTDFVSNSSSCCYMIPLSTTHDQSQWRKNTLKPFPDNNKLQMKFDDFTTCSIYTGLDSIWAFICTQLIHWVIPEVIEGTNKTKKRILRELYNSDEYIRLNNAVIEYLNKQGIRCDGIELDEEEILEYDGVFTLRPECDLDHESVFDGFDHMMAEAKCDSIQELIWGLKSIEINWG